MIPTTEVNGTSIEALMLYLAILGIILLFSSWLRIKVPFLKKYYIPASLIAGFIGLLMGPYFLNIIPQHIISCWSALSGKLIVLVFAPMLMGKKAKGAAGSFARKTFNNVCYGYLGCFAQYAIPCLLTALLFVPLFGVNPLFGATIECGWAGGHGTASGLLSVFEGLGWAEGQSIAVTNATFGLLCGIFGGVVLINIAVRKGWTAVIKNEGGKLGIENKNEEMYTENKPVDTHLAVSGQVVDNLAFHAAILSVVILIGWIANKLLKQYLNFSVSWYVTAMFAGLLVQAVLNKCKAGDAVDMKVMSRIQGISLEFLVAGAVASLNVTVVLKYAAPLIIVNLAVLLFMLWFSLVQARGIFGEYWFENAMMTYGMYTGVAATGMLLLKVCDPEAKSDALPLYAARSPFTAWAIGGGVITSLAPGWVDKFGVLTVGLVALGGAIVAFALPFICKTWYGKKKAA